MAADDDQTDDYDGPWKDVLEAWFPQAIARFFPDVAAEIDWARGHRFLDGELRKITRDAETGRRYVDKLTQVWRHGATEETWVLVHVEVQGQPDDRFPRRMFTYSYRLFDHYDRPVASFAILADTQPRWRPEEFRQDL